MKFGNSVKEDDIGPRAGVKGNGLLGTATDWKMRVDLKQRMEFPSETAVTNSHLVGENNAGRATRIDCNMGCEKEPEIPRAGEGL